MGGPTRWCWSGELKADFADVWGHFLICRVFAWYTLYTHIDFAHGSDVSDIVEDSEYAAEPFKLEKANIIPPLNNIKSAINDDKGPLLTLCMVRTLQLNCPAAAGRK